MTELDELDMEQASEFLTVAATLVYAKSRSLFPPVLKETDGDETEEDPGEALIRQLREYKAFKEAAKQCASLRMRHTECEPNRPRNSLCRQKK